MTTLTRLAGMTDVPDPSTDPELAPSLISRRSRASLPPSRRPSHRSLHSALSRSSLTASLPPPPTTTPGGTASTWPTPLVDEGEDIPWGAAHPCYPHANPHVSPDSAAARETRIIRVPRDWLVAGDAYPAYANVYPEILADWVSEEDFRALVTGVNSRLRKAFDASRPRAMIDAALGLATGWLWEDLGFTGVKAGIKDLEGWMEGWNREREGEGNPARVIALRRTGFLNLDIQIPDPEIDFVD